MNVIENEIKAAVDKELETAMENFGLHHSMHEKAAVTYEELQEAQQEMEQCSGWIRDAWKNVRMNLNDDADYAFECLYTHAVRLAIEACQLAAMCQKPVRDNITQIPF